MGSYKYSHKIGRGGMAQVYLAIQEGIGGFEKPVVVKRIFSHLCESERFVKMFLDEARLAATVRHPNVVEILDIGRDEEGYFIVMEYLSGETVALVAQTLSRQKRTVAPHIACRIGASVAAGLHHAHEATDASGNRQPLVHRDVTPSNLILCYNGAVKIVDFGIAKAIESAEEGSDASAIKGKLSYLAPEQIRNRGLDARTDVFQLGIVLHEMLCGRRLFNARSNHQKILAVLNREIPRPSSYNPDIPDYVDDIVLHALERDRNKRIQSADELRERLENALERMSQPVSDAQLGSWLRTTFSTAHEERVELERTAIKAARSADKIVDTTGNPDGAGTGSHSGVRRSSLSNLSEQPTRRSSASPSASRSASVDQGDRAFGGPTATSTPSAMSAANPGARPSTSIPSLASARSIHDRPDSARPVALNRRASEPSVAAGNERAGFETEGPTPSANGERVAREHRRPDSLISVLLANAKKDGGAPGHDPALQQQPMDLPVQTLQNGAVAAPVAERRRSFWPLLLVAIVVIGLAGALVLGPDDEQAGNTGQAGFASQPKLVDNSDRDGERAAPAGDLDSTSSSAGDKGEVPTYDVSLVTVPKTAKLVFNGSSDHSVGSFYRTLPRDGAEHMLVVSAPGHTTEVLQFSNEELPPPVVRLQPLAASDGENAGSSDRAKQPDGKGDRLSRRKRRNRRNRSNGKKTDAEVKNGGQDSGKTDGKKSDGKKSDGDNWPSNPKSDNIDPWAD